MMPGMSKIFFASAVVTLLLLSACVTESQNKALGETDLKRAAELNAQLGIDHLRSGRLELAQEKLTKAVGQDANNADAQSALGILYLRTGENDKAGRHLRKALSLKPDDPALANSYGVYLCDSGQEKESIQYFTEAARNPRYSTRASAWVNAGNCALKIPDIEQAEGFYRQALNMDSRRNEALAQLAQISFQRGEYLKARAFIQRYERNTTVLSAQLLLLAARNELQLKDRTAARAYAQRLRTEYPEASSDLEEIGL